MRFPRCLHLQQFPHGAESPTRGIRRRHPPYSFCTLRLSMGLGWRVPHKQDSTHRSSSSAPARRRILRKGSLRTLDPWSRRNNSPLPQSHPKAHRGTLLCLPVFQRSLQFHNRFPRPPDLPQSRFRREPWYSKERFLPFPQRWLQCGNLGLNLAQKYGNLQR